MAVAVNVGGQVAAAQLLTREGAHLRLGGRGRLGIGLAQYGDARKGIGVGEDRRVAEVDDPLHHGLFGEVAPQRLAIAGP